MTPQSSSENVKKSLCLPIGSKAHSLRNEQEMDLGGNPSQKYQYCFKT